MISAVERIARFASRMTFFSLSLRLSLLKIFLVTEYGSLEKRVSRMNEIILKNRFSEIGITYSSDRRSYRGVRAGIAASFGNQAALDQAAYTFLGASG